MKIILSRKGFDSTSGGFPSPIYKNNFYSIPIPCAGTNVFYKDLLFCGGHSYLDVMNDLRIINFSEAHLDPDLKKSVLKNRSKYWLPAFGQEGIPAAMLRNNTVKEKDLFLFFGWFKEIEYQNGKFRYLPDAPDIHAIFGYFK